MSVGEIGKNAMTVLEKRYLAKDENGNLTETVEGMFRRVSDTIAASDANYDKDADVKKLSDEFYDMMTERRQSAGTAFRMLRASCRGQHGGNF